MSKENEQRIKGVKKLINDGFTDKQIALITKFSQSFINRIRNGKRHANVSLDESDTNLFSSAEKKRIETLNRLLSMPEMWGAGFTDNDVLYIHTLKFLGIPKEKVFNLYAHLSQKTFGKIWQKADVQIKTFNPEKLGISNYDYLDLIIDYFIK